MANQPTKYRKFVIGAASAALVATAVAPVASAKDFSDMKGNTHEEAVKALSDAGIINGYPDGTFQPNKTLTRSDVVKMMGKWLESLGYKAAEDYKTNPRFSDLTTKTNDELLKYAAIVKDNGVFIGNNGKLDPAGDITRENMALVLVRAFSKVKDVDLVEFVAGQDFKGDVTDLASAKAEAQPAIKVLDYFDITNPAAPAFNPKSTTTRGHFASFLHRAINTDFADVEGVTVKAVNATTVEVSFKDPVENINSLNFTIEGLEVKNAAVKQTDNKTVVLTTATQKGGEKYTVQMNGEKIGTFEGISAVIPTKIELTTQSVQGKTGQQAVLKADVGVKQAGIPVTFNVEAKGTTLNKDQVFEVLTDENGIATFSYTQYAPGTDEVTAYPTGAPTVRDLGYVFWGVDTILTIEETDKKGNKVNNGEDKTYKIKYLDPKTGKPVANKKFNVTFAENIDVNVNELKNAKVNGIQPKQLLNNSKPAVAEIQTDSKGEATFTVTGQNTEVTPVVFELDTRESATEFEKVTYKASKLQAKADKVTFGAVQSDYVIEVERKGGEEAATGLENGREYEIVLKSKDGKVVANETIQIALNERIDRNMNTNTKAKLAKKFKNGTADSPQDDVSVTTDKDGKAKFYVVTESQNKDDYATPIVWIDVNSSDAKEGNFDEGEPHKIAPITYFAAPKVSSGFVKAVKEVSEAELKEDSVKEFKDGKFGYIVFAPANQSGKLYRDNIDKISATFAVTNTGSKAVEVDGIVVSPGRSYTVTNPSIVNGFPQIKIDAKNETTSVKVVAHGTASINEDGTKRQVNLGSHTVETKFVSTKDVADTFTGFIYDINEKDKEVYFIEEIGNSYVLKNAVSYDKATFKFSNGNTLSPEKFIDLVNEKKPNIEVTYVKDKDGKVSFEIIDVNGTSGVAKVFTKDNATESIASTVDGHVIVTGKNVTLNGGTAGATINGNLYVQGSTDITLDNVTVTGTTYINNGDGNTATFKKSKLNVVDVNIAEHVKLEESTKIETLNVKADGVKLDGTGVIDKLVVAKDVKQPEIIGTGLTIKEGNFKKTPKVTAQDATKDAKGAILGTTTAMQYKKKDAPDSEWKTASSGKTEVEPETYVIRYAQTETTPASEVTEVTVKPYKVSEEVTAAKEKLGNLLVEANKLNEKDYTAESWEAFDTAKTAATEALNTDDLSKLNNAISDLEKAKSNLKKPTELKPAEKPTVDVTVEDAVVTLTFNTNVIVPNETIDIDGSKGTVAQAENKTKVTITFTDALPTTGTGNLEVTVPETDTHEEGKFTFTVKVDDTGSWSVTSEK